tara:strand:+ start:17412 stop:17672 length:261 start_codon:yes stop_codon:yes gene_type:complete
MALRSGVFSIIHLSTNADFANYRYYQVYAGAGGAPVINGVAVTMAAASTLDISIKSISSVAGIYVLGDKKDVIDGAQTLSNYPMPV